MKHRAASLRQQSFLVSFWLQSAPFHVPKRRWALWAIWVSVGVQAPKPQSPNYPGYIASQNSPKWSRENYRNSTTWFLASNNIHWPHSKKWGSNPPEPVFLWRSEGGSWPPLFRVRSRNVAWRQQYTYNIMLLLFYKLCVCNLATFLLFNCISDF